MLLEAIQGAGDIRLTGALDRADSDALGSDATAFLGHASGVMVRSDIAAGLAGADVLIDFTRPEGTLRHLEVCRKLGVNMVVGTTGMNAQEKAQLGAAAQDIGIVFAPNMSVGVTLLINLVEQAAKVLSEGYDIEVVEMHHRHKVDAPSGTALRLGEAAAKGLGQDLKDCAIYGREGNTGERNRKTIGFSTIRAGDIVGDHTVMFADEGERVEITHKATSRMTFANGAIRASIWLKDKPKGLFDMQDVLGLS